MGELLGMELASTDGAWLTFTEGTSECSTVGEPLGMELASTNGA